MKINKIIKNKHKLIKLKLIRTKIYKKQLTNQKSVENILYKLKKALHVIYKYHMNNQRILFIGLPINVNKNLLKTKHIFMPESVWMNGLITNPNSYFKYLSKNQQTMNTKYSKLLLQTKKKSDLIVILNSTNRALSEGYTSRIPVISFNLDKIKIDEKSSYKIPGNFTFINKKINDNFFYSLLNSTFKKSKLDFKNDNLSKNKIKNTFFSSQNNLKFKNTKQNYKTRRKN